MKLKNVKRGVRVMLKEDDSHNTDLKKGATGTIMEDLDDRPRIKWDNFTAGTNGFMGEMSDMEDIWAVQIKKLKRIK